MVNVKISKPYRRWLYGLLALSWFSGITFFILHTWFMVEGDYGLVKHPWQFPMLQIHGAAAFLMMITFGFLLGTHVPHSWKVKPKRKLGIALIAIISFQIITAYILYYIAQDDPRLIVAYAHLVVGASFPIILTLHVWMKKRAKISKRDKKRDKQARKKMRRHKKNEY
jgi:hypothetical protein